MPFCAASLLHTRARARTHTQSAISKRQLTATSVCRVMNICIQMHNFKQQCLCKPLLAQMLHKFCPTHRNAVSLPCLPYTAIGLYLEWNVSSPQTSQPVNQIIILILFSHLHLDLSISLSPYVFRPNYYTSHFSHTDYISHYASVVLF
jgi:hypothetical protein